MKSKGQRNDIENSLESVRDYGQAVWLDFLARRFIAEGGLKKLIRHDGLTGVTSNPSIFEKAIAGKYSFGVVKAAQARGDFDVLAGRGRRVLRVHLGAHVAAGLTTLGEAVRRALA